MSGVSAVSRAVSLRVSPHGILRGLSRGIQPRRCRVVVAAPSLSILTLHPLSSPATSILASLPSRVVVAHPLSSPRRRRIVVAPSPHPLSSFPHPVLVSVVASSSSATTAPSSVRVWHRAFSGLNCSAMCSAHRPSLHGLQFQAQPSKRQGQPPSLLSPVSLQVQTPAMQRPSMQPASSLQVSKSWSRRPHVTGALTLALTATQQQQQPVDWWLLLG